jgi:hypothetical protein
MLGYAVLVFAGEVDRESAKGRPVVASCLSFDDADRLEALSLEQVLPKMCDLVSSSGVLQFVARDLFLPYQLLPYQLSRNGQSHLGSVG